MLGGVRVGSPNRLRHIPLSWDVEKARSNHEPKFRPVGDAILRGRERSVGQVMEEMFAAMPPVEPIIAGDMDVAAYFAGAMEVAEPYRARIAEILQPTFNEGALMGQDRIRADTNEQLRRLGSPLRLTDADGDVTKATANPQTVGGVRVGRSPKAVWAAVGVEAFDDVSAASVQYAQFRSGTLVTAMVEEQQRVIRSVIGESFTAQQTFQPVEGFPARTVTGLTAQQTSRALVTVLQDVNPTTSVGQNLARFRGVNMNGLTKPWERAVYHRAERMADALTKQGVTGVKAQMRIQKSAQRHADKLRRSRARMISRTEIKRAQVHGQLASMRQAVSDGLVDPQTAAKKWITGATDVCQVCSDLGMSRAIALDQSFEGVGDGPPAHPNCRCDLDFAHTLSQAPTAVGAAGPNSPYRPGTQENPIVWKFPSGFQTKPSATRFFPPSVPVRPPPAAVPSAAKPSPGQDRRPPLPRQRRPQPTEPPAPVEVPVRPAETLPGSNAEIVWDDAGRKWADLTHEERVFLYESHLDDLVREGYDEVLAVHVADIDLPVTRPPLPDDAPESIRAIYRQADRVDELKAQEAAAKAVDEIGVGEAIRSDFHATEWRDRFLTWADDTTEGYAVPEGGRLSDSFGRLTGAAREDGIGLGRSTRRLVVGEAADLADPNAPIGIWDVFAAMKRVHPDVRSLPSSVLAELETQVTKLGTMIRTEAAARTGGAAAAAEAPSSWVTMQFPRGATTSSDDVAAMSARISKLDGRYSTLKGELDEALDVADAGRLPRRSLEGRRPRFDTRSEELEYLAVWEPLETALADAVDDALRLVVEAVSGADDASAIAAQVGRIKQGVQSRLRGAYDPMDEAARLVDEAITGLRRDFPDAFRVQDDMTVLELLKPGGANPMAFQYQAERRLVDGVLGDLATAHRYIQTLVDEGFDEIAEAVAEKVRLLYAVKGSTRGLDQSVASSLTTTRIEAALVEKVHELGKVLLAGDTAAAERLLLGQLSRIAADAVSDLRAAIGEVIREVRLIGGETFTFETGVQLPYHTGFKSITPRVREALDSLEEAVEGWMPTDWIVRSNRRGRLGFNGEGRRAHYRDAGDGLINIGRTGSVPDQSVMFHEVGHRAQRATPLHSDLERAWVERRVAASPADKQVVRRLDDLRPGHGYDDWEIAVEDEFLTPYIGKDYSQRLGGGGYRETTPMALQELTGNQLAGGTSRALADGDLDMVDWIIGMLAGV